MEFATLASNAFGKHTPDNFMLTASLTMLSYFCECDEDDAHTP